MKGYALIVLSEFLVNPLLTDRPSVYFLPSVAARKEVTIPMKPELEIVLGEKRWINTVVAKDIKVGEDFDLFCNVTMDVGHVAQINWLRNVRRTYPHSNNILTVHFFQSEPLQRQSIDKVGHKNNNTSKYYFNKLTFINVTMEDSGEYTCIVKNHVGQQNNETIEVNVIQGNLSKWRFEGIFLHLILCCR